MFLFHYTNQKFGETEIYFLTIKQLDSISYIKHKNACLF